MTAKDATDHEVRIRILESISTKIDKRFDSIENKLDARFLLLIGLVLTSIVIPIVLHYLRLT